jgi:hypothetical protein
MKLVAKRRALIPVAAVALAAVLLLAPAANAAAPVPTLASTSQYKALVAYVAKLRGLQLQPTTAAQKAVYEGQLTAKHGATVNKSSALFGRAKKVAKKENQATFKRFSLKVRKAEATDIAELRDEYDNRLANAAADYGARIDGIEAEYDARIASLQKQIQRLRVQKAKVKSLEKKANVQKVISGLISQVADEKKREIDDLSDAKARYADEQAKIRQAKAVDTAEIRETSQNAIDNLRNRSNRAYNNKLATLQLRRTNQLLDLEAKLNEGRAFIATMPVVG